MNGEITPASGATREVAHRPVYEGELVDDDGTLLLYEQPEGDIIDAEVVESPSELGTIFTPRQLESTPLTPEPTRIDLAFVDQSVDARHAARDEADRRLTEELNTGNKVSKFFKGIWKGNVAKDYYRLKYTREAEAHISETNSTLAFETTYDRATRAKLATIDRFTSEYDETLHADAGERKEVLGSDSEIAQGVKQLIRRSVEEGWSDDVLVEERTRLLNAYRETYGDELLGEGVVMADNLLAARAATLGAIEHGESIDSVLDNMRITIGESRSGVRTEAHLNMVDRAIEKLNKTKIGSLVGPEVVATTATIAASLLRVGSQKAISAAAMTLVPGIGAGVWAGLRENKRVKEERAQHARESAQGKEFGEADTRRMEMEDARYETVQAAELAAALRDRIGEDVDLSNIDSLQALIDTLTATQTRIQLSDTRKIDLISYSASDAIEEERLALDIAMAEAKTAAKQQLTPEARAALGVDNAVSLQELLGQRSDAFIDSMESDISTKDRAFRKLKNRRVATAAAAGVLTGLTFGIAAQEGIAALDGTRQGLVEQLWGAHNELYNGVQHQTVLEGLVNGDHGQDVTTHHGPENTFTSHTLGEANSVYEVSSDHTLVNNGDNTISLIDPTGHASIDRLPVAPDGSLPQASIDALRDHGMAVLDKSSTVDVVTHETVSVPTQQYLDTHGVSVNRDLWYDNNTPAPVFDRNELGLQWGGNTGIGSDGGYALNVSGMTPDGSFTGDQSANWATEAQQGALKLAVSGSVDSQGSVLMVDIRPDGTVDIPADSPAAHFFANENGRAVFKGGYAEVVQMTGVDAQGVEHIRPLATLVGGDTVSTVPDVITTHTPVAHHEYSITSAGYDTVETSSSFTEMAPVIPVISRRSMESPRTRERPSSPYYNGYQSGEMTPEQERIFREETSPRLLQDPNRDLNPREELVWYKKLVRKNMGSEYVVTIDRLVADSPELSNIQPNLKTIIKVPVNAAGRAESEGIYKVLSVYARQDPESVAKSMVLLHVNWFDDLARDPASRAIIEHTKAEIDRARADFPDLKIASIESEWERSEMQGGVIGHVSRRLNDAALFAVEGAMAKGNLADDQDVLLIRNDADAIGIGGNYLKSYVEGAEANARTDVFTGTTTFDNVKASSLPGMVYATNFMQSLDLLAAKREGDVHTGGANFAVRASTLAAVGNVGFKDESGKPYNGAGSDDVQIGMRIVQARKRRSVQRSGLVGYYQRLRDGYHGQSNAEGASRKIAVRLGGARVDTDSDREEKLYLQGIPMVNTWNREHGFDKNGYQDRDANLSDLRKNFVESMKTSPDVVVERVRADMEGSINQMGKSDSVIRAALAFSFMLPDGQDSTAAYELNRVATGDEDRPYKFELKLTETGKKHLVNHLQRDSRGRFDGYGSRKMRQMYGETKPGNRRQATHRSMIRV